MNRSEVWSGPNFTELVDSIFYPLRVTGKSWTSFSEVQNYAREIIAIASEQTIPRNFTLYGHYDLNLNYPISLSLSSNCDDCTDEYHLERNLEVILIDDHQMARDLQSMLKSRGFKSIRLSDVQIIFRDMGLKGYITPDRRLVIMNPRGYLVEKLCGCGGNHHRELCGCGGGHHEPYCGCGADERGW